MTPSQPEIIIGIDWGDRSHAVCVITPAGELERSTLVHDPVTIATWIDALRQRFPQHQFLIAVEQSRGALVHALREFSDCVIYPINPKQSARYREAVSPSGPKSDHRDAILLAQFLQQHCGQLRPWRTDTPLTRQIASLAELRRDLVEQRKSLQLKLISRLKLYFPAILQWCEQVLSPLMLDLLARWPSLAEMKAPHPKTLRTFLARHGLKNPERQTEWINRLRAATPLTTDQALIAPYALDVQALVGQIQSLQKSIAKFDEALRVAVAEHPDAALFGAVPGAGVVLVPRLIAAFGSDRQRFQSAAEVEACAGIAPVTKQSGKMRHVTRRYACSHFLRQTFHEFADQARKWSPWSRAFYDMKRASGMRHHAAVRALAFKWIRILYHLWKTNATYCEATHLEQLRKTNSPLLKFLQTT